MLFFDRNHNKYSEHWLALPRVKLTDRVRNCFCITVDFICRSFIDNTPTLYNQISFSVSNVIPVFSTAADIISMIV